MHQPEVYQKIMLKHYLELIVVVQSIKVQIHHRQVSFFYFSTDSHILMQKYIFSEKASLLSRLFRRSGRQKQRQLEVFSAQFPPAEWFNSKAVHLHSIGTQTVDRVSSSIFVVIMKKKYL